MANSVRPSSAVTIHRFAPRQVDSEELAERLTGFFVGRRGDLDGLQRTMILTGGGTPRVTVVAEWESVAARISGVGLLRDDPELAKLAAGSGFGEHDEYQLVGLMETLAPSGGRR